MTTLTSLPDELLCNILEEAWLCLDASYHEQLSTCQWRWPSYHVQPEMPTWGFLHCMLLLCRRTHDIALPMLYAHVAGLSSTHSERFLKSVSNSPAIVALIQGLEIRVIALPERGEALHRLSALFHIAPNLETLHLTGSNRTDSPAVMEAKLEPYLIESIASLPSLRSLHLLHWWLALSDVPLLATAIANMPHLVRFGIITVCSVCSS